MVKPMNSKACCVGLHGLWLFMTWVVISTLVWVSTVSAGLTTQEMDLGDVEDLDIEAMLQQDIKMAEAMGRKRGRHLPDGDMESKASQNYSHPIFRPGLVEDIRYTYRHYRQMILVRAGNVWVGTNDPESTTGEYPMRQVAVKSFHLDANPVINAEYWAYRAQKKFVRSEAEQRGWSWVVDLFLTNTTRTKHSMPGATGWAAVKRAHWDAPEGPGSSLEERWTHPVTHLSWHDAQQFCQFYGKRLPTEPEWEHAARAGITNRAYPWGDNWERKRANVWQGKWPHENKVGDGYNITSPVDAFRPQNLVGFYDLVGNVWEWTSSSYVERMVQAHLQTPMVVLKGGSYVDSVSGRVNKPVRCGQRMGQRQDYTAANVGFRCARSAPEFDPKLEATAQFLDVTLDQNKRKKRKFHLRRDEL